MPNTDALAEAEWHLCAAEYRVMLAMRLRASNDNDIDDAQISGLFSDLQAAIARLRALKAEMAPAQTNQQGSAPRW